MLELAIKARVPIIRCRTTDLLNLKDVLTCLAPEGVVIDELSNAQQGALTPRKAAVLYAVKEFAIDRSHYDSLVEDSRTLILVNQGEECPYAFDAGEVPVPRELMENILQMVTSKGKVAELLPCFNGLTLKVMQEVIRLTETKDKALTPRGVTQVRAMLAGKLQGLGHVNTALPLYIVPPKLQAWMLKNKRYFLESKDNRLIPRGILLNGDPGVGKSMAAKYIANEFGVPLYRLDLSSSLSKWQGDSERSFARVLDTLDTEEPAVFLIDEGEKLFGEKEDEGTASIPLLLAQLLWWMQEHTSRVLTVVTTNHMSKLPPELWRAGRIDMTMTIQRPTKAEAEALALAALAQFVKVTPAHRREVQKALVALDKEFDGDARPSHADITHLVVDTVKENRWTG